MSGNLKIREEFRRDGLAVNFRVDAMAIRLFAKCFPNSMINIGYACIGENEKKTCKSILEFNRDNPYNNEFCISGHANKTHIEYIHSLIKDYENTSAAIWVPAGNNFFNSKKSEIVKDETISLIKEWKQWCDKPIDIALADSTSEDADFSQISKNISDYIEAGVRYVIICDSMGIADKNSLKRLFDIIDKKNLPFIEFHAHNDNGKALENINYLRNIYGISIFSTSIFSSSERKSLIETTELIKPFDSESFDVFKDYYKRTIIEPSGEKNEDNYLKLVYNGNIIVTGAQNELLNNSSANLFIGSTTNRKIASKVIGRDIQIGELSYLKDKLIYDSDNLLTLSKADVENEYNKSILNIQNYISDVIPPWDIVFNFSKNLCQDLSNDINIVCLGAGLGLYNIPFFTKLKELKNNENNGNIRIICIDKNYYNLLFTYVLTKEYKLVSSDLKQAYEDRWFNKIDFTKFFENSIETISIGKNFTIDFLRKDIENKLIIEELKDLGLRKIDILYAPAILHQLNNPWYSFSQFIDEFDVNKVVLSSISGDWLLFMGMLEDYKLRTPINFFDNNKLDAWNKIYNITNKINNPDGYEFQVIANELDNIFDFIEKNDKSELIVKTNENFKNKTIEWIEGNSRSFTQKLSQEERNKLKELISNSDLDKHQFVHLANLIAYNINKSKQNSIVRELKNFHVSSKNDISEIIKRANRNICSYGKYHKLKFIVSLPFVYSEEQAWILELGSIYINNKLNINEAKENLLDLILASLPRTKLFDSDITNFLFNKFLENFESDFIIKLKFLHNKDIPTFNISFYKLKYNQNIIEICIDYKENLQFEELKKSIIIEFPKEFYYILNKIYQSDGVLYSESILYINRIIKKINNNLFDTIKSKVNGLNPVVYFDPKTPGFIKNEFETFLNSKDIGIKYLISLHLLSSFEVLYGIPDRQVFFNKKVGGSVFWLYFKEDLIQDTEALFLKNTHTSLKLAGDKIAIYDYTQIMLKQQLKTAIISILIDSYAHNISAHSLSALKWWFELRAKIMEKRIYLGKKTPLSIETLQPQKIEISRTIKDAEKKYDCDVFNDNDQLVKTTLRYYESLGLTDSSYNAQYYSLADYLRFVGKDDLKNLFTFSKTQKPNEINDSSGFHPRFPVPIDYAIFPFFRFLRDKGAFWSGVTRDMAFGGESKSWFKILWEDFANNPLYLGTIAKSEGVDKLCIYLAIKHKSKEYPDGKWINGPFVYIDMSVIDYETEIANSATLSPPEHKKIEKSKTSSSCKYDCGIDNINYSPYAFIRPAGCFKAFREILNTPEYSAFMPGGIVGEHALFTIFENTLRNIKHYKESFETIRKDGIQFWISIEDETLGNNISDSSINKSELFKVSTWLAHETKLFDNHPLAENLLLKKVTDSTLSSILDESSGSPRMGGNSQDKACAAMLFNNEFKSVERRETERDKKFFPWIRYSHAPESDMFNDIGFDDGYYSGDEAKINDALNTYTLKIGSNGTNTKGFLKKAFKVWRGENYFLIDDKERLREENVSRFKIVVINTDDKSKVKEIKDALCEAGVIRILEEEDLKKINNTLSIKTNSEKSYYELIKEHFSVGVKKDTKIPEKEKENEIERRIFGEFYGIWLQNWTKSNEYNILIQEIVNASNETEICAIELDSNRVVKIDITFSRLEGYKKPKTDLFLSHGSSEQDKCCNVRSHGYFWGTIFNHYPQKQASSLGLSSYKYPHENLSYLFEFIETIYTRIVIIDNRIFRKFESFSKEKIEVFDNQLHLRMLEEKEDALKDIDKSDILIIHLSFIESLKSNVNNQTYTEDTIFEFINERLQDVFDKNSNFKLFITTGRGRDKWRNSIAEKDKEGKYLNRIYFKPVESIINSVESGVSYNDNYDVKHNLCKVIFGS